MHCLRIGAYTCMYILCIVRVCYLVCVSHWLCVSACAHECMCVSASICGGNSPFLLKLISVCHKTEFPIDLALISGDCVVHPTQTLSRFTATDNNLHFALVAAARLNNGLPTRSGL